MRRTASILTFAALGVATLHAGPSASADDVLVGFAIAQSGWMQPYDETSRAAELAIEDLNARGGLLGRKITTIYADTKTDPAESAKAGLEVATKGAELVVVSCDFDMGAPAALAAQNAGKIAFSLCAADPKMGVQGVGPLAYTASFAGPTEGAVMAKWGYENRGFRKAYVLTDTIIENTKAVCGGFAEVWSGYPDAKIVGRDTFKNNDPSIAAQVTRIKALSEQPDVIELCSFPPGGPSAIRQLRAAGIETPIFANMGMDGNYWFDAVPNLSNFYVPVRGSVYGNDPDTKIEELNQRLKAKYGGVPATSYMYHGYALIELWAAAVEKAGTTEAAAVAAELDKLSDYPTLIGPMSFTPELHIQNKGRYLIQEVQNGEPKPIEYVMSPEIPMDQLFKQ